MDEQLIAGESGVLDAQAISVLLPKSRLSENGKDAGTGKVYAEVNAEIAQRALTRLAVNQSGGLPGLPAKTPSLLRKFLSILNR